MDPTEPQPEPAVRVGVSPKALEPADGGEPLLFSRTTGRRRVRSGPIAAMLAVAVVLAVTALPAAAPRITPLVPAPKTLTTSPVEPVSRALAMIQLGSPFSGLVPMPGALLEGLDDGSERLTFQLREAEASSDGPAVFHGSIEFLRPIAADDPGADDLRFFQPREDRLPGEPALRPVEFRHEVLPGSDAFRAARGELIGVGEYAGVLLTVRTAPGSGVWCPRDRRFAHLLWFRDASTIGHAVPDMGMGEVSLRRARLR